MDHGHQTEHVASNKHEGHNIDAFRNKFWVSLALSFFVVLYSGILSKLFNFYAPAFPGSPYLAPVLGSVVFFYGGWVFVAGAYR